MRTSRKPETSELPTQTEMRQLLELAIDKGVEQFLGRAERLGFYVPRIPASIETIEAEQDHLDGQMEELE